MDDFEIDAEIRALELAREHDALGPDEEALCLAAGVACCADANEEGL